MKSSTKVSCEIISVTTGAVLATGYGSTRSIAAERAAASWVRSWSKIDKSSMVVFRFTTTPAGYILARAGSDGAR
jgi:hypothetical protein